MANNPKFEPLAGKPYDIMFTSDKPKMGEGNYGTWWLYTIELDGQKYSWFPNEMQNEMIERAKVTNGCHVKLIVQQRKTSDGKPFNAFKLIRADGSTFFSHGDDSEPVADGETPPPDDSDMPYQEQEAKPEAEKVSPMERVAGIMQECLYESKKMCDEIFGKDDLLACSPEDIRTIAISMFISRDRSGE